MDENLTGMDRLRYQGMIYFVKAVRHMADSTCKYFEPVEFKTKLPAKQYVSLDSVYLCSSQKNGWKKEH